VMVSQKMPESIRKNKNVRNCLFTLLNKKSLKVLYRLLILTALTLHS